jgi:site-specific DNA-methyltransferase (adenine-specific)
VATRTRTFGAGNRESHDAADFYARFTAPELSRDQTVNPCAAADTLVVGDARDMAKVDDNSVALVVTSPPYFAGKAYETDLGAGHIPGTYLEYLRMLRDVFAECRRVLEPGGRIAVNVANLGRKPYRSLAGDVTAILQDELALLLRGEVVWVKAKGAAGSCAFGSYMQASNPVLRDVSERVVIASKGRFDRAIKARERAARGLPHRSTISKEEFLASTLDVWEIRPESARRVQHPAPFPVELPERLINLYTYEGDVVLDPFLGSGSTAIAAVRTGRRYVGYDTDPAYVDIARARVEAADVERGAARPG